MTNETENLDNWDDFTGGTFLKAADVTSESQGYVCLQVSGTQVERKPVVRLTLSNDKKEYLFDLNKTNGRRAKELGITSPSNCLGKTLYFKKVLVRNPKTNQEVDGLRLYKIA